MYTPINPHEAPKEPSLAELKHQKEKVIQKLVEIRRKEKSQEKLSLKMEVISG